VVEVGRDRVVDRQQDYELQGRSCGEDSIRESLQLAGQLAWLHCILLASLLVVARTRRTT
jgi:hypothetical protein